MFCACSPPCLLCALCFFFLVSDQIINGSVKAKALTDIYYLLRKELNEKEVRRIISTIAELFDIIDTTGADCRLALLSDMKNYEDVIMVETAKRINADGIVTRNLKDYQTEEVKIYAPDVLRKIVSEF